MQEIEVIQGHEVAIKQTLGADLFQRFIDFLDASPKTVETYTRALRQLLTYLAKNGITQPKREDVIAFREDLKERGLKPSTVQNYMVAAKLFFRWTAQEGFYPNIAEHLKGAKLNRDHKKDYLTSYQVREVLEGIERDTVKGLRDYAILCLMVTGGLRTIEVSRANVGDLRNMGESTVLFVQGKGKEEKTDYVKLSPQVEKALRAYLKARGKADEKEPFFTSTSNNNSGERMTTRTISGIVKERFRAAGFDSSRLTAHSLRHTAVTLSLLQGKDLAEVQQFARHANISTTMIYNHALDKAKNGCSAAVSELIF